ncbi:hypothetical protein CEXT_282521 [Caerostris extrusa]|uniref:Uncharacterized protein n=1 Tax=Caerostris extrusa TaxID=172846 RepID=A0AAV4QNT6_CAEEX|nr:hypothetical protein CEXT_282521 [Caerostris extrusa]
MKSEAFLSPNERARRKKGKKKKHSSHPTQLENEISKPSFNHILFPFHPMQSSSSSSTGALISCALKNDVGEKKKTENDIQYRKIGKVKMAAKRKE